MSCCTPSDNGYDAEYTMSVNIEVLPGDFVPRQARQGSWNDGRLDGPLVVKEVLKDDHTICTPPCTPVPGTIFRFALQVRATSQQSVTVQTI